MLNQELSREEKEAIKSRAAELEETGK